MSKVSIITLLNQQGEFAESQLKEDSTHFLIDKRSSHIRVGSMEKKSSKNKPKPFLILKPGA